MFRIPGTRLSCCVLAGVLAATAARKDQANDLMAAVQNGDAAKVDILLQQGADPNSDAQLSRSGSTSRMSVLTVAAGRGDLTIVKALLAKGADVNRLPPSDRPALDFAVGRQNLALVNLLLSAGANPLLRDREGNTPFSRSKEHLAAAPNPFGGLNNLPTPATCASIPKAIPVQGYLAASCCYVALLQAMYRDSPVIFAVRTGNVGELIALNSKGADVNAHSESEPAAILHAAALAQEIGALMVQRLLAAGADANARTPSGKAISMDIVVGGLQFRVVAGGSTPLMLAASNANLRLISTLVNGGADLSARNEKGQTACDLVPGPLNQNDSMMLMLENEARRQNGLPAKPSPVPDSSRLAAAKELLQCRQEEPQIKSPPSLLGPRKRDQ